MQLLSSVEIFEAFNDTHMEKLQKQFDAIISNNGIFAAWYCFFDIFTQVIKFCKFRCLIL